MKITPEIRKAADLALANNTYDTEPEAVRAMHTYARNLRRLRQTSRYGVLIERRKGAWWLCLNDRLTP